MFRQKALDRLRSPEDLDQLLAVIPMRSWFILATLGFLCSAGLVWSVLGRIPITVNGFGVLINPGNVKGIQSRGTGEVGELSVRVGQVVKANSVLAKLNQPELELHIRQAREKLDDAKLDFKRLGEADAKHLAMELDAIAEQREFIANEITKGRELEKRLQQQHESFAEQQLENLTKTKALNEALSVALRKRVDAVKTLRKEGLTSDDLVLSMQNSFMDSEAKISDIIVGLKQLELNAIQREQSRLERLNRLADLDLQLIQLDIKKGQFEDEVKRNEADRNNQLDDLTRTLDRLLVNQEFLGAIEIPHDGRILDLTISEGQVVQAGSRVGTIEVDDPGATLKNLAYMSVKGGKLIRPGDRIRITPAVVERERYGSIVGHVTKVSPFPITREGAIINVGSPEIATALMEQGGAIEIEAELERDPASFSGYRWTSTGPRLKLSAGTTTTVRVTIEERAPITYVLPILRTWVFGRSDDKRPTF